MLKTCVKLRRFCTIVNSSGAQKLRNITRVWFTPLPPDSKFIKPCRLHFIENGVEKDRDIIKIRDGLMILIYNVTRKKLVLVRQFRAAVYHGIISGNTLDIPEGDVDLKLFPPELGVTLELCAGMVDKQKSLEEIAREEVLEECGYDVPVDSILPIYKYRSGIGASSGGHFLYYCEVNDSQKVASGGGVHDEVIEVVELSIDEVECFVQSGTEINGAPGLLVAFLWFLANKASKYRACCANDN
ncbi:uridine diphosphate glucose pyrophosphatase NUDT14-like [Scaptodrosophila lebanonensis]|uniref:Uridine diphosphate glucose pyrophosphatase NUDT14 n=1 Tax=Drosophila lebanonensis TaxID=7225 RepID=A0A6J2T4V3_DROLE|nr:uridine diphosphate glucose pyrophosphatase NUDT14-like [Scaptodrosophila lebanonensis]